MEADSLPFGELDLETSCEARFVSGVVEALELRNGKLVEDVWGDSSLSVGLILGM